MALSASHIMEGETFPSSFMAKYSDSSPRISSLMWMSANNETLIPQYLKLSYLRLIFMVIGPLSEIVIGSVVVSFILYVFF